MYLALNYQGNQYNVGNSNNGRNVIEFQSYDDRKNSFDNGTGIYINEAEIVVANIRARSSRGDEQVISNDIIISNKEEIKKQN